MPGLHFESSIDFQQMNAQLKLMEGKINDLTRSVERSGDEMQNTFNRVGTAIGAYLSVQALAGFGNELINVRGEFQQMQIALETMLGSKDKADRLMGQVVNLAAKTPFTLTQVGQATKQLLAFQFAEGEVIDTTTRLGNVAAGLSVPLDQLIRAYGQVKAKNKLMGDDMRQFTEAGVPMVAELAKVFNVTEAEVYKLVETGKVGFDDVKKVISNLTDEGGMFFNLMEKQSKSLTGMVSNLQDAWARMLNEIGQSNEGILADGISGLTNLVDNYEDVIKVVKVLIATYGAYKAAVALSTVATNGLTIAENLHYAALVIAEKAQKLLNMTSLANPYVALATALAAVVSGLYLFGSKTDEVSEKSKVLNDVTASVANQLQHETSILDVYRKRIEQTNPGSRERIRLVKELNEKYPDLLRNVDAENASIGTLTTAFNSYIANLEKTIRLKTLESQLTDIINEKQNLETQYREKAINANERYEQSLKLDERRAALIEELQYQKDLVDYGQKNADLLKEKRKLETELASVPELANQLRTNPQTFDEFKAMQESLAEVAKAAGKPFKASLDDVKKAYDDYVNSINKTNQDYESKVNRINEINNILKNGGGGSADEKKSRTVAIIDAEIKALKDDQQALSDTSKKWDDYQRKIDRLTKEREGITGNKKDDKKNTAKVGVWDEKDAFEKDLQDFATYQDKRLSIIEKYSQSRQRLEAQGYEAQAAEASTQMQKELDELDAAQFKKSESYRWVYDNIDKMGRKALKDYIARLKNEIDAFQGNEEVKLELTKKLADADEKLAEYTPDKLREGAGLLQEMAGLAGQFDEGLGKALDTAANLATGLAGAMAGFSSGNVIQGVTGVVSMVSTVAGLFKKNQKPQSQVIDEWIGKMQKLLQLQEKSLNLFADKQKVGEYSKLMATVDKQMEELMKRSQSRLDSMNRIYEMWIDGDKTFSEKFNLSSNINSWTNDDWLKAINNAVGDYKKQLESLYSEWITLQEAQQEYANQQNELLTGTTYDSIVSSIVDGFADGLFSAEDFADSFEEMMRKALLKSLEIQALQKPLQDWYNNFAAANADGLTQSEIASLQSAYSAIINSAGEYAKSLEQAAGITLSKAEDGEAGGLSGAFKGMNQESADLMAGQLGAMRIHLADIASVVTGGFNSDLRLDTADMEQSFGLGLNAINNAILQSNDYLRQIVQNTASIEEMKSILANGITIKNRGFGDSFFDRRITGR